MDPHSVVPAGQPQLPLTQLWPAAQARPHAPQFARLVRVSTHDPLQLVVPLGHPLTHAPFEQTSPAPQRFPHMPQFDALLARSTHADEQKIVSADSGYLVTTPIG